VRQQVREIVESYEPTRLELDELVPAAVLLLLYKLDGEEHLLFQVRTHLVEHHKGEISLPGGAHDVADASLEITCLRETEEEIGVDRNHIEIFGCLDDFSTRANFVMTPFVGAITEAGPYPFQLAEIEVAELLEVPLDWLRSGDALEDWTPRPGGSVMPAYRYEEHLIFGATARVIEHFLQLIADLDE
jgi:8-oxo-dGTP pyrophosphatase MutT (NUDIX family)